MSELTTYHTSFGSAQTNDLKRDPLPEEAK